MKLWIICSSKEPNPLPIGIGYSGLGAPKVDEPNSRRTEKGQGPDGPKTGTFTAVGACGAPRVQCEKFWTPNIVALLLVVFGSTELPLTLTLAVLVIFPATVGVTTIVTVAVVPLAILPRLQVTVPVWPASGVLQLPWVDVAETNFTLVGSVSVIPTLVAVSGPLLATTIV